MQWTAICPRLGCDKVEGSKRYQILTRPGGRAEVKVATREEPAVLVRDGLAWLVRKKRLSVEQRVAAYKYQAAFRDAGEEAAIKSSLGDGLQEVHTAPGSRDGHATTLVLGAVQAKRELFRMRFEILRGQTDMLTVMDGVCGVGWSPRELANGNGHKANELETVLRVALDLIAAATPGKPHAS